MIQDDIKRQDVKNTYHQLPTSLLDSIQSAALTRPSNMADRAQRMKNLVMQMIEDGSFAQVVPGQVLEAHA